MVDFLKNKISLRKVHQKGFTLIELLVTISIFVVLTGVVLFSQKGFDNSVLLSNLAYDTALTIRQAQSYGVNNNESSSNTFAPYGVYYDIGPGGNNTNFVLFTDTITGTGNSSTTASVTSCPSGDPECVQKYTIKRGSKISNICVGSSDATCDPAVQRLSILFKRPNPDAMIYIVGTGGSISAPQAYARITVSSVDGASQKIIVRSVGQIYVQK